MVFLLLGTLMEETGSDDVCFLSENVRSKRAVMFEILIVSVCV
jgi:hypothetical protein